MPDKTTVAGELPALPVADFYGSQAVPEDTPLFTADQMRAYATAALAQKDALAERLKLEAQCHAQEARTANATIAEIYQACTGATGEPSNWHGAEPVRQALAQKDGEIERLRSALQRIVDLDKSPAFKSLAAHGYLAKKIARAALGSQA